MKTLHIALITLLCFSPLNAAMAADKMGRPAVERTEVKFEPQTANVDGNTGQVTEGSVIFELSHRWGAQIDALLGDVDTEFGDYDVRGATLHVFRRDPSTGMVDFSLSTTDTGGIDYSRIEVLVDYYWDKRTLTLTTGYTFGDIAHAVFGGIQLREYLTDAFNLNLNVTAAGSQTIAGVGFDFRLPVNGVHLFGQSLAGNNNFDATVVGLRFYFGGSDSSNQQRDRGLLLESGIFSSFYESFGDIQEAQFLDQVPRTDSSNEVDCEQNPFDPRCQQFPEGGGGSPGGITFNQ